MDDRTSCIVFQNLFGLEPAYNSKPLHLPQLKSHGKDDSQVQDYRMEAAGRLSSNYQVIIADILTNCGIKKWVNPDTLPAIKVAIDWNLRRLAYALIQGHISSSEKIVTPQVYFDAYLGVESISPVQEVAAYGAIGTIALAYLRNRVCVPRDMSADAAIAFRAAIDAMLCNFYQGDF